MYAVFNRRNALEAKEKITDPKCQIFTLNSLGYRFVLQQWNGVRPDDDVEYDRIKEVVGNSHEFKRFEKTPTRAIKEVVAFAKNTKPYAKLADLLAIADFRGIDVEDGFEREGWTIELVCSAALKVMELSKKRDAKNRISFNDQVWLPVVMGWVRPWFDLVVVDEAQDMNAVQLTMARKACKPAGRIVLVGDPRQAIYGFRGADVGGMERLKKDLSAATFPLTITYRCPKKVVEIAKKMVPDYEAAPEAPEGTVTTMLEGRLAAEAKPGDAVVSRTNAPLMRLCLGLLRKGTKAYIEGRDIGATLLGIHAKLPASDIKSYQMGLDAWAAGRIKRVAAPPESDAYKAAIQTIEDQAETLKALSEESATVQEVESRLLTLFQDNEGGKAGFVTLSSVHRAKGLEWHRVFLVQESFKRANLESWVASEEQNIAYTAVTRARHDLTWLLPENQDGKKNARFNDALKKG